MTDTAASTPTPHRGRKLTIAAIVTAGLASGGIVAANATSASGSAPGSTSSGSTSSGTASSSTAAPQPGGPRGMHGADDLDGTITAVSSSSVTVRDPFGTSRTYAITSSTTVHRGPATTASTSALAVGQHVGVRGEKVSSTLRATDIDIRAAHLDGSVTAVSGDEVTITDRDGFTRQIQLSSSTAYLKDGAKATRTAVVTGAVVRAEGSVDSDKTTLDATQIEVLTKAPAHPDGPHGGPAGGPGRGGPRHP